MSGTARKMENLPASRLNNNLLLYFGRVFTAYGFRRVRSRLAPDNMPHAAARPRAPDTPTPVLFWGSAQPPRASIRILMSFQMKGYAEGTMRKLRCWLFK
ncbi:hypothetical protein Trydic_g19597 [Trypoxylus dichotomus]